MFYGLLFCFLTHAAFFVVEVVCSIHRA